MDIQHKINYKISVIYEPIHQFFIPPIVVGDASPQGVTVKVVLDFLAVVLRVFSSVLRAPHPSLCLYYLLMKFYFLQTKI